MHFHHEWYQASRYVREPYVDNSGEGGVRVDRMLTLEIGMDDPNKIVKVLASDGKSGEQREIAYTSCRMIGNGSFGVVFQARLVHFQPDGSEVPASESSDESNNVAIKKVLQDKRFKVRFAYTH